MSGDNRKNAIAIADEALLAELGYKQEFQRAFTPLEVHIIPLSIIKGLTVAFQVFGIAFSIIGLLPSIA